MGFFPISQNTSKQTCTSTDSARPWTRGNINYSHRNRRRMPTIDGSLFSRWVTVNQWISSAVKALE